jgi:hypothetical protein
MLGIDHPGYEPTGRFSCESLADLDFEQVDDFYGITERGNVLVWLIPLIDGQEAYHEEGPFDVVRISCEPGRVRSDSFLEVIKRLAELPCSEVVYKDSPIDLKKEKRFETIREDCKSLQRLP